MPNTQAQARQEIQTLVERYYRLTKTDLQTLSEASVVHQFITPLLRALNWPIDDPQHFKYELTTQAGRPDMTLLPAQGGTIFLEAKRFGLIKDLHVARQTITGIITPGQMVLPGMATDRTTEEQQAINYAFANAGQWAILTNFQKLRLFNARHDWLVLSFEDPRAYLDEFDLLWQLAYENILQGGLEALSNQRYRQDVDTDYLSFINEWREQLAQDIVAHPRANPWACLPDGHLNLAALRAVVQRTIDRLVVVRFAEDHLVMPAGTLYGLYELSANNRYADSLANMIALLCRRFDEYHDSALFAPGLADQARFSDDVLRRLVAKLYEARYRAMSPDIMGNTYEQYLGQTLVQVNGSVKTADNLETRKKQGSYYTPQVIVRYLVDHSLGRYLYGTENGRPAGQPLPGAQRKTSAEIRDLRVLDMACGSGSFLINAYWVLADFYRREMERLEQAIRQRIQDLIAQGITLPLDLEIQTAGLRAEIERLRDYPRLILQTHLYGVDLDPQAAELATVNLMMQGMADQPRSQRELPLILNQNVKVGNSLIGAGPGDSRYSEHAGALAALRRARLQLAAETAHTDHAAALQQLADLAAPVNAALNAPLAGHFADVAAVHPFHWAVEFPEAFVDDQGQPLPALGFQIIIGNPPWEIVKPDLREFYAQFDPDIESRFTRAQVEQRIAELEADPQIAAAWAAQQARIEAVAAYYRQAADYTRQGRGDTATHKLFLERAYALLTAGGYLGFVVPSGLYTDLGTQALREMLLNEGNIQYLYSFSNERFFFVGVDHRFKFVLLGAQKGPQTEGFWAAFRFNPRVAVAPDDLAAFLADPANLIYVRRHSLERFSPDSLSLMEFQDRPDYEITEKIYDGWPLLGETLETAWNVKLGNDSPEKRWSFSHNIV